MKALLFLSLPLLLAIVGSEAAITADAVAKCPNQWTLDSMNNVCYKSECDDTFVSSRNRCEMDLPNNEVGCPGEWTMDTILEVCFKPECEETFNVAMDRCEREVILNNVQTDGQTQAFGGGMP